MYAKYYLDRQLGSISDHVLFSSHRNDVTLIAFSPLSLMININNLSKWKAGFTLRLDAAKNMHYIKKMLQIKVVEY